MFYTKILDYGIFFRNFENYENFQNFELKFPKSEANFDAERGIWGEMVDIQDLRQAY